MGVSPELRSGAVIEREYRTTGVHPISLTVRDHALQADTAASTLTIVDGDPPVADAAGPYTAEVGSFIFFNGTGSSDDTAIESFAWDFGETTGGPSDVGSRNANLPYVGRGPIPRHFYKNTGTFNVGLTVTDNTLKSDTTSTTVDVIIGDPPQAAMKPVTANAVNGPPAYFDGRPSTDDFGVVEYRWDFDADSDRDGDGDPTNDIDGVGPPLPHLPNCSHRRHRHTLFR